MAATYAGAVKAATAEARARHYESSRAMSMAGENVPVEVYDNLVATVRKHMPAMHRYVRLRKKMLGVDELHFYDVYAPLVGDLKKSYTYETAQQMVLKAVAPLGEDYQKDVQKAYNEGWIDVYPNRGKRGGAYSGGCYDSNPYILLNFSGTLDSVSTLAHEMGHTMPAGAPASISRRSTLTTRCSWPRSRPLSTRTCSSSSCSRTRTTPRPASTC